MDCQHFKRKFAEFSREKRSIVALALSNEYLCPHCHVIHKIEEEKTNE